MKIKDSTYKNKFLNIFIFIVILCFSNTIAAQGFLKTEGKKIVNGNGENFILRGIGTGNWMLQEGYMMQSTGFAATQHEFRNKLIETVGLEKTDKFYDSWLTNHFQKTDLDSMSAWGFNSIRVAMHYKWFTPPIEEETVPGEITWLNKGFEMMDSLLDWCESNQMYLILDLHGAPGGQGKNADICDYDPSKPSLWESDLNKDKTVALWRKLAERYSNETWIGGYDLINEVNWSFPEGNNSQLRQLYIRITNAIREVDNKHIIFIEGNWFANDFSDLTPAWDENMVYSFHKYWSYNNKNSLKWVTDLRDQTNCPLWLGESGENSNTWFTNLIKLSEDNNIGWSWWPVKKDRINNILNVETNEAYKNLMNVWSNNGTVSADYAYNAVMQFSEDHRFENSTIQYDVIDALIRQPYSTETLPFKNHTTDRLIFATDYDLGRNNFAYYDLDTADYHLDTDKFISWNTGWSYRNDGVDIENCTDKDTSNGYQIGWINKGEWLQYTINSTEEAAYKLKIRTASDKGSSFYVEVNGKVASEICSLPATGSWTTWVTSTINDIILPQGEVKVKIVFDDGGVNFNHFTFSDPKETEEVPFELLSVTTPNIENKIFVNVNKAITSGTENTSISDFQLIVNSALLTISEIIFPDNNNQQIILLTENDLFSTDNIRVSYKGNTILNGSQKLATFTGYIVQNNFLIHYVIPGKINAEDYFVNKGFKFEECTDIGGGLNSAFSNDGDYLDYLVDVQEAGTYNMDVRVATEDNAAEVLVMNSFEDRIIANKLIKIQSTGGWQSWQTQAVELILPKGKIILRIYSRKGEHNLNWYSFDFITRAKNTPTNNTLKVYPNPAKDSVSVEFYSQGEKLLALYNIQGEKVLEKLTSNQNITIETKEYPAGIYILQVEGKNLNEALKLQITK